MKMNLKDRPCTIDGAVSMLLASFSEDDLDFIRTSEKVPYHFGPGMAIRNAWRLWEKENPLVQDARNTFNIAHADDISGLIFEWAIAKVKGVDFDPHKFAKDVDDFWMEKYGYTALESVDGVKDND